MAGMRVTGLLAAAICVIGVLAAAMSLAADRFVSGIADLPLMPGLEEVDDSAVIFSKPEGRIVEVSAYGAVTRDAVRAFYDRTLPQLGWRQLHALVWQRENELLRFDMREDPKGLVIQFSLTPHIESIHWKGLIHELPHDHRRNTGQCRSCHSEPARRS